MGREDVPLFEINSFEIPTDSAPRRVKSVFLFRSHFDKLPKVLGQRPFRIRITFVLIK